MSPHFDALETRSQDARRADQDRVLQEILAGIHSAPPEWLALAEQIGGVDDLTRLPVLRKSDLAEWQQARPPFGGIQAQNVVHYFQSPGPIYEPGGASHDWWRMGRFLYAAGIGPKDIVQNCFSYHLTPAGHIFENGARAVGAAIIPAGVGQTELQVRAAADIGATAYAGTPDYLKIILDAADEAGVQLGITKAVVGGGALFPSLRQYYSDQGITCLQNYATADLGNIAYESPAMEGLILDEHVIVEIVRPGTGDRVAPGEVGEVIVTALNPDYPLIRFATGDLSAILPGDSPCGRTNTRIKGWMGRADQTTKVKGMFVRPEQVAQIMAHHPEIKRARLQVTRENETDVMHVLVEAEGADQGAVEASVQAVTKLRAAVSIVAPNSLPNDGKVIDDQRSLD